jgi:hypothetical protein
VEACLGGLLLEDLLVGEWRRIDLRRLVILDDGISMLLHVRQPQFDDGAGARWR